MPLKKYKSFKKYLEFVELVKKSRKYSLKKVRSYEIVIHWLNTKLSHNQFLIFSGILVGCSAGLAGVVLKTLVHYIHFIITSKVHFSEQIIFLRAFPFPGYSAHYTHCDLLFQRTGP